ncbi:MAG: ribulose-phosphate 3-epimerase, partial [Coriobacteriia bacterium]|nr:ribulose-phosphate 3-epimerase [Coriobacteriia bacterium]
GNRIVHHIHERGARAGIALNPATPIAAVREYVEIADLILLMSVNPGFGGQKFIGSTTRHTRARRLWASPG